MQSCGCDSIVHPPLGVRPRSPAARISRIFMPTDFLRSKGVGADSTVLPTEAANFKLFAHTTPGIPSAAHTISEATSSAFPLVTIATYEIRITSPAFPWAPPGKHGGAVSFLKLPIQFLGYLA